VKPGETRSIFCLVHFTLRYSVRTRLSAPFILSLPLGFFSVLQISCAIP